MMLRAVMPTSGSSIFLDQASGTRRLNLSATSTDGAMIWSQPEENSQLVFDVSNINFKSAGYLLKSGSFYPSITNTKSLGLTTLYFANSYINNDM